MRKSESIIKLQELGLNTLNYFITNNKQEVIHYLAKNAETKLSLRTERGDEYELPFYYMIPGEKLLPIALKHLTEGYKLIFAPSLDVKGCLLFGVVAYGFQRPDCMEFVVGEGKVREVYSHPNKQSVYIEERRLVPFLDKDYPGVAIHLNKIYRKLRDIVFDEIPCCVEWSLYNKGVGVLHDPLIVWELRPYE